MLTLYVKPSCPFSNRVLAELDKLELEYERKDITSDIEAAGALLELGGKKQTPYLYDTEREEGLYESDDIVKYLKEHYGGGVEEAASAPRPRVHMSDSTCVSCEG